MTKLIAPEYLKEFLFHETVMDGSSARGLETLSLGRLLNDEEEISEPVLILKLAKQLKSESDRFPDYKAMFGFPSFYHEVISFAKQLALFNLDENDLPADDSAEEQLRMIVKTALQAELKEKKTVLKLERSIEKALADKDMKLVKTFESDYFSYLIRQRLRENGMETVSLKTAEPEKISRRHALSTRMEIEACAQAICDNEKPCTVILCAPQKQMPVLAQVFARYGIPYSYTAMKRPAVLGTCFRVLTEFACSPDADHLCAAIENNAFPYSCSDGVLTFLKQVLDGIEAPHRTEAYRAAYAKTGSDKYDPDKAHKRDPVSVYASLEEQADRYFALIRESIDSLVNAETPGEKLLKSYDILSRSPLLANSDEMAAGRAILSALQDCIELITTDEEALFFCRIIESLSANSHRLVTDFCTVTDLSHPVSAKENTYVLGTGGTDYPGFSPLSGLFDEQYAARIRNFPALEKRQEAYISQLDWITESCSDELIWSYATNDYQGRELISAFEIEQYGKSQRWPLVYRDLKRDSAHAITKETAKDLFVRKDEEGPYISGSISSVENWFACPYRYFLSSGLYIRRPQIPDLSADSSGVWQHAVLEQAVMKEDGTPDPSYAAALTKERIEELISPYFEALLIAAPGDEARIALSKERMISSLMKAAEFLEGYEDATSLSPCETEKTFRRWNVSPHVKLTGTIDRTSYDPRNHMLAVIDYKSSSHTLSEANVSSGQQLQLLTYLIAAVDLWEKEEEIIPAGTYYFSLRAQDITKKDDVKEYSVNRSSWKLKENPLRTEDDSARRELMIKNRKLNGWTFTERLDVIDSENKYVAGTSKQRIYDNARECLVTLYEYFYEQLLGETPEGVPSVDVSPSDTACQWCDYRDVCRFHGEPAGKEAVYTGKLTAERKKKDED